MACEWMNGIKQQSQGRGDLWSQCAAWLEAARKSRIHPSCDDIGFYSFGKGFSISSVDDQDYLLV